MKWNGKKASSVVAAGLLTAAVADASPFVNLQIMGSTNGGQSYSSTLTVTPGETIEYEVEGELNQSAVTNANHPYTLSSAGQSATLDGITSLDFDLVDSGSGTFANESLDSANGWTGAGGPPITSAGTVSGNKLEDIFPAQSAGTVAGGTSESVMLIGNFTVSSSPSTETLTGKWYTEGQSGIQTAGAIKVATTTSTHQSIIPSYTPGSPATGSESTADPYVAYGTGLTLDVTPPALTWGGAGGGTWDIGSTASFTANGSSTPVTYADGSAVTFGDTDAGGTAVSNTNPIAITSNGVKPASVSFTNSSLNTYRFTTTGTVGIGGNTSVSIIGGGTVIFSSLNTYTGGTSIGNGTLKAASGSLSSTGTVTIGAAGNLYVGDGSSSVPSTLATGNQTWTGGGSYLPKVDGSGTADLLNIDGGTGTLTLTGTGVFNIVPQVGDVALGATPENWEIAAFSSTIAGYTGTLPTQTGVANGVPASSQFALNTAALSEPSADFSLSLVEVSSGDDALYLDYAQTPEPGTAILVLGGAAPMFLARRRRRAGKTSKEAAGRSC